MVEGNSKLTAAGAVAEVAAFGSGGWLVQWLTAPLAILLDAVSFLWSALLVMRIRAPEPPPSADQGREGIAAEIAEGLRAVIGNPTLRALAGSNAALNLAFGIVGTVFLLYVNQELGFGAGVLGLIFAVGGVTSLAGAVLAARVSRLGIGPTLIASLALVGLGTTLVPLATTANAVAVVLLVAQQLVSDPAATVYDINQVSLRQAITPDRLLGRVNASVRVLEVGASLAGALLGGILGETVGLRFTFACGVAVIGVGAVGLLLSPVRGLRAMPGLAVSTGLPTGSPGLRREIDTLET